MWSRDWPVKPGGGAGADGHPTLLGGDARTAWQDARAAEVRIAPFNTAELVDADLLVDAILGTGLEREVSGAMAGGDRSDERHPAATLALDIPSGLHADTGAILGAATHAAATMTFIGLKQGLFTGQGPACCGDGRVCRSRRSARHLSGDASRPVGAIPAKTCRSCCRAVGAAPTKGHFGHVLVVGGDRGWRRGADGG
jgi:hypothetical protein